MGAMLIASNELAAHAQKDIKWRDVLAGPDRKKAIEALDAELDSLCKTILEEILPSDSGWETSVECATPGRILLDIKRSGKYKARGEKQGFRENKLVADGPDFNCYSHVVKFDTVRAALYR